MDGSSQYVEGCCIRRDQGSDHHTHRKHVHTHNCTDAHKSEKLPLNLIQPDVPVYQWPL